MSDIKLCNREPTPEMIKAAEIMASRHDNGSSWITKFWQCMFDASPSSRGEAVALEALSESDKDIALAQAVTFAEYVSDHAKGSMVEAAKRFLSLDYSKQIAERLANTAPVVAGEVMLALAAKWREQAELNPLFLDGDYCQAKNDCADELTAAIGRE